MMDQREPAAVAAAEHKGSNPKKGIFLSVIINNYNYAAFIAEAIESALANCSPDCEIIVVDDGSTDDSLEIIRGYQNITVVAKENGGQASALNAGFAVANGSYIQFLDADDLLVPGAVDSIRRTMPGKHMIHYSMELLDQQLGVVSFYNSSRIKPVPQLWEALIGRGCAWLYPMSCHVFSAELLSQVFPLPEKNWRVCADLVCVILASQHTQYFGSAEVINRYRVHGSNLYFSNTLNTWDSMLTEADNQKKISLHYRLFYMAGSEALQRVTDVESCKAVVSHWITFGELLLQSELLTPRHRDDVMRASDDLLESQTAGFWQQAARVLFSNQVDPVYLQAFHSPPGKWLSNDRQDKVCKALVFGSQLSPENFSGYFHGGIAAFDEEEGSSAYSLSQACCFTARVNSLSGFFRLRLSILEDTLSGATRIINADGRLIDLLQDESELLADIPCDWVSDGQLQFYFIFESLSLPKADGISDSDLSLTGAYLKGVRFDVPFGNHFFPPLRANSTVTAASLLSPLRHLASERSSLVRPDGSVVLTTSPVTLGMSLAFAEREKEWLEIGLHNNSGTDVTLLVQYEYALEYSLFQVRDQLVVPASSSNCVPLPIQFSEQMGTLPELSLTCLSSTEGELVVVNTVRHFSDDEGVMYLPEAGALSFGDESMGCICLGSQWSISRQGVAPKDFEFGINKPASISIKTRRPLKGIRCVFLSDSESLETEERKGESRIWVSIDQRRLSFTLDANRACILPIDDTNSAVIRGWWGEKVTNKYILAEIEGIWSEVY